MYGFVAMVLPDVHIKNKHGALRRACQPLAAIENLRFNRFRDQPLILIGRRFEWWRLAGIFRCFFQL